MIGLQTVVSEYITTLSCSYDAWGNHRDPATWETNDYSSTLGISRGYTMHEMLPEFQLINMNGRMYDPVIGRVLSPDNYVQSPFNAQNYNRYSYCLNNPLKYTDPDGESFWLVAATIYTLFFTDFGYDIQKTISPVAVKVDLGFGNQGGIGIDASVGVPQAFPISYRVHGGATYYWKNTDLMGNDMSGWETRHGGEWGISGYMFGIPIKATYGGTTFNSKWSGEQTTNLITFGNPLINIKYENDMDLGFNMPGVPRGDGDRYRTAAAQINVGPFSVGTNMITGDAGKDRWSHTEDINGHETYVPYGEYNPNSHRMGTFYFKLGTFRLGWNSEGNRKVFQNQFAHSFLTGGGSKWFEVLSLKTRFYWQFGYSGGGTLW
jgi:RHS repeat-associated protein